MSTFSGWKSKVWLILLIFHQALSPVWGISCRGVLDKVIDPRLGDKSTYTSVDFIRDLENSYWSKWKKDLLYSLWAPPDREGASPGGFYQPRRVDTLRL